MNLKALKEPFPVSLIQWKPQATSEDRGSALAVAYIDARAVMARLDEVVGQDSWQDEYSVVEYQGKLRMCCTLSIWCGPEKGWIGKQGFGEPPEGRQIDEGKGAESDALKRAAVKWGIGRYIYAFPKRWLDAEFGSNGKFRKFKQAPQVPEWAHPTAGPIGSEYEGLPESEDDDDKAPEKWAPKTVAEVKKAWLGAAFPGGDKTEDGVKSLIEALGDLYTDLSKKETDLPDVANKGLAKIEEWKKGG